MNYQRPSIAHTNALPSPSNDLASPHFIPPVALVGVGTPRLRAGLNASTPAGSVHLGAAPPALAGQLCEIFP